MGRRIARLAAAVAGLALWAGVAQASIQANFNGAATDLSGPFNINKNGAPVTNNPTWAATAGIGGSGGLTSNNNDVTCVYVGSGGVSSAQAFNLTSPVTTSLYFKPTAFAAGDRFLMLGFINQVNSSFNSDGASTPANTAFVGIRPYGTGKLEFQKKDANGGTTNVLPRGDQTPSDMLANVWYKLSFTVQETDLATSTFKYWVKLENYGADGLATPTTLFDNSASPTTVSVAGLAFGNGIGYAAFRQAGGAVNMDNFAVTVVPEPATMSLVGLSALAMLRRRR